MFFFHPPLPVHARKNYSRPGICSGRVELKSLSWAWQTSRRSRQLFQGQPWRMRSSRLTLQGEEPCAAGSGPAPLCSCLGGLGAGGVPQGGWVVGCCKPPPQKAASSDRSLFGAGRRAAGASASRAPRPRLVASPRPVQGWPWEGGRIGPRAAPCVPMGAGCRAL